MKHYFTAVKQEMAYINLLNAFKQQFSPLAKAADTTAIDKLSC